nr:uncharacterized protein LOC117443859 [Pseudochaenichthys georgianus]
MKTDLETLGLWPGSSPVRHLTNMLSLWRYPPQPELIDSISDLPSPKYHQLHPHFIWKPEHAITDRVRNNGVLPRLYGCPNPQVVSSGAGRPRVILGTSGQYYILASRLTCKVCKKYWHADKPQWLEKLPQWLEKLPQWLEKLPQWLEKLPQWLEKLPQWLEKLPQWLEKLPQWLEKLPQWLEKLPQWLEKLPRRFSNIVPAFLTHTKAVCTCVLDEMRRSGRSPRTRPSSWRRRSVCSMRALTWPTCCVCRMSGMLRQESTAKGPSLGSSDRKRLRLHVVDTRMVMAGVESLPLPSPWSRWRSSSLCCFRGLWTGPEVRSHSQRG